MPRPYEVVIIVDAGLDDGAIQQVLNKATEVIVAGGGTPGRLDRWGRRRFAYELKHRLEGYYAVLETTAEPPAMSELDRVLSLADEVIRHKIIRIPDQVIADRAARAARTAEALRAPAVAAPAAEANGNGA